ncbi:chitobiase/beta-hexosaminidase C-terminal domain-containing protein [Lignipirellula cremea]|uniref:Carboxylesterase family protein n=1 Tax=Lignipirellula cremea TaxID=2528010 RepID=A0A518DKG6_9BACT|nr:chitobiase/beta-hexosaminidase C-terminal domain-containing protein [Lignipirellula cremea]QDU92327.1 Carboxylesterase family protein [Lignipirellula cremea]
MRNSAFAVWWKNWTVVLLMVFVSALQADENLPEMRPPKPIEGAVNHLDVAYLPDRLTGCWEDRWLKMNIHVPPGEGPFPCLVFVHGGGYGGGDKDGGLWNAGPGSEFSTRVKAVEAGYVVVNMNYILTYGGASQPQVFWDFRSAIRFLRANAEKYRIDPGRIGAWGFSAGGWLASSASFADADDLYRLRATAQPGFDQRLHLLELPYDDPRAPYDAFSSRLTCVVADLWKSPELLRPQSPALLTLVGAGANHRDAEKLGGGRMDLLQFTNPKYAGQSSLHVPKVTEPVKSLHGNGESTYEVEALRWLDQELTGDKVRAIPPEARPLLRRFAEQVAIRLIAASPDAVIHYTIDCSEPNSSSPVFERPFTITDTTVVKAISVRQGERPSAASIATFVKGEPPPAIMGPETIVLPSARVGRPYSQAFVAVGASVWNLTGMIDLSQQGNKRFVDPGIRLDATTGVLSGAPQRAGAFTFQIQAAQGFFKQADARCYLLNVEPADNE